MNKKQIEIERENDLALIMNYNNVTREQAIKIKDDYAHKFRTKEYWLIRGYSEENAIIEYRKRLPGTYEYFKYFKNITPDEKCYELEKEFWSKKACTLKNMKARYGEELGQKRFDEYREKQAYSNTLEYMINKYGEEKGTAKYYTANEKRAVTLPNLIAKHGEIDGNEIYSNYIQQQAYTNSEEYFKEKLGDEEGVKKYKLINLMKGHSYESYLIRYDGDIEKATIDYTEYCAKRDNYKGSNIAGQLWLYLIPYCIMEGWKKIFCGVYNQEWYFTIKDFGFVKVDYFVKDTGKIIEFYGDYWHANPCKYNSTDIVNYPHNKKYIAQDIWDKDQLRLEYIKKIPYVKDILIVWEYDFIKNKNATIDKCKQFLNK